MSEVLEDVAGTWERVWSALPSSGPKEVWACLFPILGSSLADHSLSRFGGTWLVAPWCFFHGRFMIRPLSACEVLNVTPCRNCPRNLTVPYVILL